MTPIQYAVEKVLLEHLRLSPDNARQFHDEARIMELAGDLAENGQICPLIGLRNGDLIDVIDGGARFSAARVAGLTELSVLICDRQPARAETLQLQARIDAHRKNFNPIELSDLLAKIQVETKCTVNELAKQIGKSQPSIFRLLGLQRLCPSVRKLLEAGQIDQEKAFTISQESDAGKQVELAHEAKSMSREQLRNRLNSPNHNEAKTNSARFPMPGDVTVIVQSRDLSLSCCIDVLIETVKQLKRGQREAHDINTLTRVMRNQLKQLPKSVLRERKGLA